MNHAEKNVADVICRLKSIAFGSDKLSRETKDAMLYS